MLHRVTSGRVADSVLQQILSLVKTAPAGSRIPSERLLAQQMGVSRASVREAIRMLVAMGALEIRPGRGSFVTEGLSKLAEPEEWFPWILSHKEEIVAMLEVRDALASKAAALAAVRATREEIMRLKLNIDTAEAILHSSEFDAQRFAEADLEFHDLVAHASHNTLLAKITCEVYRLLVEGRKEMSAVAPRAALSIQQHRAIYEAISRRDPAEARRLMSLHVDSVLQSVMMMTGEGGGGAHSGTSS